MRFVLDASIAITWAMRDEAHPLADLAFEALKSGSAIAPSIWWYEVRNILVMNERRRRILPEDSVRFLNSVEQLPIVVDHGVDGRSVMESARKLGLTVYDASYLVLAIRDHLPLATLDKDLQNAAASMGISLLA